MQVALTLSHSEVDGYRKSEELTKMGVLDYNILDSNCTTVYIQATACDIWFNKEHQDRLYKGTLTYTSLLSLLIIVHIVTATHL